MVLLPLSPAPRSSSLICEQSGGGGYSTAGTSRGRTHSNLCRCLVIILSNLTIELCVTFTCFHLFDGLCRADPHSLLRVVGVTKIGNLYDVAFERQLTTLAAKSDQGGGITGEGTLSSSGAGKAGGLLVERRQKPGKNKTSTSGGLWGPLLLHSPGDWQVL